MSRGLELAKLPRFHPDIDYSDESPASRLKAELFARDYGAVADGTLRTVADWLAPGLPTRIKYRSLAALQVDYPHVTNPSDPLDWAAIQKAINTGKNVAFHDGRYMIGAKQLVLASAGQSLYGLNGNFGGTTSESAAAGAFIVFTPPAGDTKQAALLCRGSLQSIVGLKFVSQGTTGDNRAVQAQKTNNNNDDLDIAIISCQFSNCYESIYAYGRGVRVTGCLFVSNNSGYAITSDWPATGVAGDQIQSGDLYKGRALVVRDNRIHGSGALLRLRNYVARGMQLADNLCDVGARLLVCESGSMTGGVRNATISANICDLVGSTPIYFGPGTTVNRLSIDGGAYGGAAAGIIDGDDRRPGAVAVFDGCAEIDGVTFDGVLMHDTDGSTIQFVNDAGRPAITVKNISLTGGQVSAFGQSGVDRAVLYSVYDMANVTFAPASISNAGPSANALVRTAGKTITGLVFGGACITSDLPLLANTTSIGAQSEGGAVNLRVLGGVGDAVALNTAVLAAAVANYSSIIIPKGEYLVGSLTIPAGVTLRFEQGGMLRIAAGATLTIDGRIVAGPYQRIFSGELVQSGFLSGQTPPFVFGVRGNPQNEWTSPCWFGAVGDGSATVTADAAMTAGNATLTSATAAFTLADVGKTILVKYAGPAGADLKTTIAARLSATQVLLTLAASSTVSAVDYHYGTNNRFALNCWLYFGNNLYLPSGNYLTDADHNWKRSNVRLFGDGKSSVLHGISGTSAVLALSGAGVGIQRALTVENICIDAGDIEGYNAIGLGYVDDCVVRNIWTRNCGHYAATIQYYSKGNLIDTLTVDDAATSPLSMRATISLEGTAGVIYDVRDNVIRSTNCKIAGNNGIILHNVGPNTIDGFHADQATKDLTTGGGTFVRLRDVVIGCTLRRISVRLLSGTLISTDAGAVDIRIYGLKAETIIGQAGTDYGKIGLILGVNIHIHDLNAYSSDADVATVFSIAGSGNRLFSSKLKSDSTGTLLAMSGTDNAVIDSELNAPNATVRVANISGITNGIRGGRVVRPDGVQGVRLYTGTGLFVTHCTISGDGDGVVRIDGDVVRPMMTGNMFTGANARSEVFHTANTSLGVTCNNAGDLRTIGQFAKLGDRTIWADSTGRLRIITGPTANIDTDGTVVGTQT